LRNFLNRKRNADPPGLRIFGKGAIIMTGTLAQAIAGAMEPDKGRQDDVRRDPGCICGQLFQPERAGQKRFAIPGQKDQWSFAVDHMGQGKPTASCLRRGMKQPGISFSAHGVIGRDDQPGAQQSKESDWSGGCGAVRF
jgi:hypothetical protein